MRIRIKFATIFAKLTCAPGPFNDGTGVAQIGRFEDNVETMGKLEKERPRAL